MLIFGGVLTVIPLLLFAAAAEKISLTLIGMIQYIAPSLQILLGLEDLGLHVRRERVEQDFSAVGRGHGLLSLETQGHAHHHGGQLQNCFERDSHC